MLQLSCKVAFLFNPQVQTDFGSHPETTADFANGLAPVDRSERPVEEFAWQQIGNLPVSRRLIRRRRRKAVRRLPSYKYVPRQYRDGIIDEAYRFPENKLGRVLKRVLELSGIKRVVPSETSLVSGSSQITSTR